ncbi:hypothetical protein CON36_32625 [Bacillus cereus]|uniref:RNA polymerase sigma-70 region 2 domain-containing protein n=3 Tax=Bacillus TaxID=1386 RepID=A0A9X6XVI8_BACCE|nr:hypothetical protein CON36_32625 [Bacillus cereus]
MNLNITSCGGKAMSLSAFLSKYNIDDLFLLENSKETKSDYEISESTCSSENLVGLHNNSKLLFPSYFLRFGAFESVVELDEKVLNVLLEAGSVKAYEELKNRYGKNLAKAPDEFLVIGAQRNGRLERDILTENYESIIERIINRVDKRYYFKGQEKEDLIQEAFMGFLKAIEVYKIERRTKFKDFSHYVIQRHLGTLMNRSKNYRNRALNESFSYNMPVNNNNETTFEELLEGTTSSPEKVIEDQGTYVEIREKLTENEQEVLDFYVDGYTYEEIAYELIKKKKQINFDGMNYEEVSSSIKLYEAYKTAIESLHKQLTKKAVSEISSLLEELVIQTIMHDESNKENVVELMITHIKELEFELHLTDSKKWCSETIMDVILQPISNVLHKESHKEMLQELTKLKELAQLNIENEVYQKNLKKLKKAIEKELVSIISVFVHDTIIYDDEEITDKVLNLDLQILKEMTKEQVLLDIQVKFSYMNTDGLTWKEIAHEMKRKKKSVDNTIQRIRNKGYQHQEEFEEIMKKELSL